MTYDGWLIDGFPDADPRAYPRSMERLARLDVFVVQPTFGLEHCGN